jgi:DNA adenine methylase
MDQYFPDLRDYKEFREPFLGGGSVAIHIAKKYPHLNIWVNDLYEPLVNFWQQLQMFGVDIKDKLTDYKLTHNTPTLAKELFLNSKERSPSRHRLGTSLCGGSKSCLIILR